eukprot:SAG11_NODE_92_length_17132_cov_10.277285_19_plen_156_part_00
MSSELQRQDTATYTRKRKGDFATMGIRAPNLAAKHQHQQPRQQLLQQLQRGSRGGFAAQSIRFELGVASAGIQPKASATNSVGGGNESPTNESPALQELRGESWAMQGAVPQFPVQGTPGRGAGVSLENRVGHQPTGGATARSTDLAENLMKIDA